MALLIRFDDILWESLLVVIRYIKRATGNEPNQEELAQALQMLIRDGSLRRKMSAANIHKIAEAFTWSVNADRYEHIYQTTLMTS